MMLKKIINSKSMEIIWEIKIKIELINQSYNQVNKKSLKKNKIII